MHKQNRFLEVLLPSMASGLVAGLSSLAGLTIATFSYFAGNGAIYDYLFGPNSSLELVGQSKGLIDAFSNTVLGNPTLNKILYFAFWMIVGLLVYFLLYVIIKGATTAVEDIEETKYLNSRLNELLESLISRLAIRTIFIIIWILYWIFFVKTLVPFSILSTRIGVTNFPGWNGWLYATLGVVIMTVSLHIHIVLLRLIALRVRLLDSSDVVD